MYGKNNRCAECGVGGRGQSTLPISPISRETWPYCMLALGSFCVVLWCALLQKKCQNHNTLFPLSVCSSFLSLPFASLLFGHTVGFLLSLPVKHHGSLLVIGSLHAGHIGQAGLCATGTVSRNSHWITTNKLMRFISS